MINLLVELQSRRGFQLLDRVLRDCFLLGCRSPKLCQSDRLDLPTHDLFCTFSSSLKRPQLPLEILLSAYVKTMDDHGPERIRCALHTLSEVPFLIER